MVLFFHSIASLVMAEYACASPIFTSFINALPLVCVDPKYLNWSTSSSTSPFDHMLVDGLDLMLLTSILLLSELISMLYPAAVFPSLSMSCWSFSSLPSSRSMSSANCRLQISHDLVDTDNGCQFLQAKFTCNTKMFLFIVQAQIKNSFSSWSLHSCNWC